MLGINLQDYVTSSLYGTDKTSNTSFLRGALPHKTGGLPQLMRATLPYNSVPTANDNVTGVGDFNIFNIFLLKPIKGYEFGIGPLFTLPTASKDETGAGLWQAGASVAAIKTEHWGVFGGLITYQHDFAGPSERPTQNMASVQPFLNYNLPHGLYARSAGIWSFNWQNGNYYIPIGAGLGKVWKMKSGTVLNLFVEPQWTVAHEGDGLPQFQTFLGLNMQFPL